MDQHLTIPHRTSHGMCPVNGIRDLVQWRSDRDWSNEFLHGLGQGGGFAYLRFNSADPPRQVYWGIAGPRQHQYLANLLGAGYTVVENRTFKFSWSKARCAVEAGTPPVLGPLDMYYLHYYGGIYQKRHIPIHYVVLVGFDDAAAYVHDTGKHDVQAIPLDDLQSAWDVNVPGLGKRNRLAIFDVPKSFPPTGGLIRTAIADQCRAMLDPPVSMVGIPAMNKLAREIARWPDELGTDRADLSLQQVREYLNSPPDLTGDHLTAGRHIYVAFLQEAADLASLDVARSIRDLRDSMNLVPKLAEAIRHRRLEQASQLIRQIALHEAQAYQELSEAVAG